MCEEKHPKQSTNIQCVAEILNVAHLIKLGKKATSCIFYNVFHVSPHTLNQFTEKQYHFVAVVNVYCCDRSCEFSIKIADAITRVSYLSIFWLFSVYFLLKTYETCHNNTCLLQLQNGVNFESIS